MYTAYEMCSCGNRRKDHFMFVGQNILQNVKDVDLNELVGLEFSQNGKTKTNNNANCYSKR
jgi:hypothetical protein